MAKLEDNQPQEGTGGSKEIKIKDITKSYDKVLGGDPQAALDAFYKYATGEIAEAEATGKKATITFGMHVTGGNHDCSTMKTENL